MRGLGIALLVGLSFLSLAPVVYADSDADRAGADVLFNEARALLKNGAAAEACPKFAASQKLDPRPGRQLALGDCYEQAGATASAWATFVDAERAARQAKKDEKTERQRQEAARRAADLEPKLSKLVLSVETSARVPGLVVKRNGKDVDEAVWGVAVPVDPGEQKIQAEAPGRKPWSDNVKVEGPGTVTVKLPALAEAEAGAGTEAGTEAEAGAGAGAGRGKSVVLMAAGGGLGLVLLGTGIGFFVVAGQRDGDALAMRDAMPDAVCNEQHPLHPDYRSQCGDLQSKLDGSHTFHNVGVGMMVAGSAIAVGTVVYALLPSTKPASVGFSVLPLVGSGFGGVSLSGRF